MSTLHKKLTEQRERAAARRFEMENLPPSAAPRPVNNIWGDATGEDRAAGTPKTGKRQMAPASRAAPFADHHGEPSDDRVLAAYASSRATPSVGVVSRTEGGGVTCCLARRTPFSASLADSVRALQW